MMKVVNESDEYQISDFSTATPYRKGVEEVMKSTDQICAMLSKWSSTEIKSIMSHPDMRHKLIKLISVRIPYYGRVPRSVSNPNGVTCYIYAAICYVILKDILNEDPSLFIGSDMAKAIGTKFCNHSWTEVCGIQYDYNLPVEAYDKKLEYHDGSWRVVFNKDRRVTHD